MTTNQEVGGSSPSGFTTLFLEIITIRCVFYVDSISKLVYNQLMVFLREATLLQTNHLKNNIMKKTDLAKYISDDLGTSANESIRIIDSVLNGFVKCLQEGGTLRLVGFGTFAVYHKKAYTGRNPQTGDPMEIPASNQVRFKPGTKLKDSVKPS